MTRDAAFAQGCRIGLVWGSIIIGGIVAICALGILAELIVERATP
jgi:hypothetical protein